MMNGKNDDQIDSLKIIHRKPDHDNIRGKINEYQVKSFVENFLDVSGIHGVSYLHSRNHWVGRLYWLTILVIGFVTAALFLKEAFFEWENKPVITTLDSIAKPISYIQFPTVTICQDEYKPPDRWAYLETILNYVEFDCDEAYGCDRNRTQKVRNDFHDLIDSVINKFKGWLFNPKNIKTPIYDVLSNTTNDRLTDGIINDIEIQLAALMIKGEVSYGDLHDLIKEHFADNVVTATILSSLSEEITDYYNDDYSYYNMFGSYGTGTSSNDVLKQCNTTECTKKLQFIDQIVRLLSTVANIESRLPFGTFVASFADLTDDFLHYNIQNQYWIKYGILQCQLVKELKQYHMHEYFQNLSKIVGFADNELVSLYDLPAIVATLNSSKFSKTEKSFQHFFLYTKCQELSAWEDNEIRYGLDSCIAKWKNLANYSMIIDKYQSLANYSGQLHPCNIKEDNLNQLCCNTWTKKLGNNLKAIMKVMRLSGGRGKSGLFDAELFQNSKPYLSYNQSRYDEYLKTYPFTTDVNSIIPWCEFKENKYVPIPKNSYGGNSYSENSCQLFDPIITDMGVCHSFNPTPTLDMLKPSYFTESFKEAFESDLPVIEKIRNAGKERALEFYLMGNNFQRKLDEGPSNFFMGISYQNDYFDMRSISENIKPGYHTTWKVQAMEITPSEDLPKVPVDKRDCKFSDETEGFELFSKYSQTSCQFECSIKKAERICGCYPWYIPAPNQTSRHTICDVYGNFCFKEITKQVYEDCLNNCHMSCHQIEFIYTEKEVVRDPEKICNEHFANGRGHSLENEIIHDMFEKGLYNSLLYKYKKISEWDKLRDINITIDKWERKHVEMEFCKILVKDHIAKVTIKFDRKKYVKTLMNIQATFYDKLANFGGTLGLFTGMSIMSMIELVYWIAKGFFKLFHLHK